MTSEKGKQGVVVVYPVTPDVRIDDGSCETCPNSLFRLSGKGIDEKLLDNTLDTWLRLGYLFEIIMRRHEVRSTMKTSN